MCRTFLARTPVFDMSWKFEAHCSILPRTTYPEIITRDCCLVIFTAINLPHCTLRFRPCKLILPERRHIIQFNKRSSWTMKSFQCIFYVICPVHVRNCARCINFTIMDSMHACRGRVSRRRPDLVRAALQI